MAQRMNLPPSNTSTAMSQPQAVVLDTNVVLDWLVFDDPGTHTLGLALQSGQLRWLQSAAMLAELQRVLDYPAVQARLSDRDTVLARAQSLSQRVNAAPPAPQALRCRDPDDQGFIDLALAEGRGCQLISRDKAVLALQKAAAASGLQILSPAQWASLQDPTVS